MSDPFIGQIASLGFNFAPINWAICQGQLLPISQYAALYNLIGTTYGGDGVQTFALPNLQSRAPICQGQGIGLSNYVMGQISGTESVALNSAQIPSHTHLVQTGPSGTTNVPSTSTYLSDEGPGTPAVTTYAAGGSGTQTALAPQTVSISGGSVPHENRQPYLAINYCIALEGIYPSQN